MKRKLIDPLVGVNECIEVKNGRFVGKAWKTKDGRLILIKDMDDKHLANTIRYLEARGVRTEEEQRTDPIAQTEVEMSNVSVVTRVQYEAMLKERERRANLPPAHTPESAAG